jgi:hypothetical protein
MVLPFQKAGDLELPALPSNDSDISQELAECGRRQSRISHNSAHRERFDRIVPWKGDLTGAIAHYNVFALP